MEKEETNKTKKEKLKILQEVYGFSELKKGQKEISGLYAFFDVDGTLLYIGESNHVLKRLKEHTWLTKKYKTRVFLRKSYPASPRRELEKNY